MGRRTAEGNDHGTQRRFDEAIERLTTIARKYHGLNALAMRRDPGLYKGNPWTNESTLKLNHNEQKTSGLRRSDELPKAAVLDWPHQWDISSDQLKTTGQET